MTLFGLAVRFGGRGRWLSGAASVLVGALSTVALATVMGLAGFLAGSERVSDSRYPGPLSAEGCVLFNQVFDPYGSVAYERLVVARAEEDRCATVAPPPGLNDWPAAGEVWASPRMVELAASDQTMAARFPSIAGVLGSEGLLAPNELRVVVGGDPAVLEAGGFAGRFDRFGAARTEWVEDTTRMSKSVILAFGLGFVVPSTAVLVYLLVGLDLKARLREARLLQLIGTSESASRALLASAAVSRACLGAAAGALGSWWWTGSHSPTFAGLRAYPGAFRLSLGGYVMCLAVVVAAAAVGMTLAVRRVGAQARSVNVASTSMLRGVAGLGLVVVAVAAAAVLDSGSLGAAIARTLAIFGAIPFTAALLAAIGRRLFVSREPLAMVVGARLRRPASAVVIAGVAFAGGVYLLSIASTTVDLASTRVAPLDALSSDGAVVVRLRGDGDVLATIGSYPKLVATEVATTAEWYGTCVDLRRIQGASPTPCPSGGLYIDPGGTLPETLPPGVVAEQARGTRGESLWGSVIWIVPPGDTIALAPRAIILALVDSSEAIPLIDAVIAADPTTHVSIGSFEWIVGASEGNAGLDVLRWAGLYSAVAALIGLAVSLITVAMERHAQTGYLHVLGLRPDELTTTDVAEPVAAYFIAAATLGPAAMILAATLASERAEPAGSAFSIAAPFLVGVVIVLVVALAARAAARFSLRRNPTLDDHGLR